MTETDAEFVERMWDGLSDIRRKDDYWKRLFALARRGAAVQDGMVMVPRTPTAGMLHCGEGITDFMLPKEMPHDHAARLKEMSVAWRVMIEQWEREAALPPRQQERRMSLVPNETEQSLNRQYNVYAAAREEYRKKISEQAARIEQLEAALRDIHASAKDNHLIANLARAALEEK